MGAWLGRSVAVAVAVVVAGGACSTPRRGVGPDGSSCGSYAVGQGAHDASEYRNQQDCLLEAFASGRHAELTYSYPTEEGDPIEVELTVVGERVVDVRTDRSEDRHGPGEVRVQRCRELAVSDGHIEVSGCVTG